MKFKVPEGVITKDSSVIVVCSDRVMAEVLTVTNNIRIEKYKVELHLDTYSDTNYNYIKAGRTGEPVEFCLRSGAKLVLNRKPNYNFRIFGYHYNGDDIVDAIKQLKEAYVFRTAIKEYFKAKRDTYD